MMTKEQRAAHHRKIETVTHALIQAALRESSDETTHPSCGITDDEVRSIAAAALGDAAMHLLASLHVGETAAHKYIAFLHRKYNDHAAVAERLDLNPRRQYQGGKQSGHA